jgi:hypothetical protein
LLRLEIHNDNRGIDDNGDDCAQLLLRHAVYRRTYYVSAKKWPRGFDGFSRLQPPEYEESGFGKRLPVCVQIYTTRTCLSRAPERVNGFYSYSVFKTMLFIILKPVSEPGYFVAS